MGGSVVTTTPAGTITFNVISLFEIVVFVRSIWADRIVVGSGWVTVVVISSAVMGGRGLANAWTKI